jgi:pimeloyl-ACP methyl ester carboxylesterase
MSSEFLRDNVERISENTIYYKEKNNGSNKALIFIHGAGKTNYTWSNQYNLNLDSNLIFLDLPNHGKSKGEIVTSINEYTTIINQLMNKLNYKTYTIAGHSMGGAIALTLALRNISSIEKIIIIDSSARLKVADFIFKAIKEGNNILTKWAYCNKTHANLIENAEKDFNDVGNDIRYIDFEACNSFDLRNEIKNITIPTLILVGECDKLTPPQFSEFMHSEIKNSYLEIIPDAGHMSMWEKPEIVNQNISKFI